ncbi:hypothetical protein BLGI_1569 [Brevibacillus laterosporus GI-9]|uniref:hypothetical protein n=1 Tax=Brevibacillus laterosporus TaxID=1465 RepID=UPI00024048B6|nr:hypothetical protein [Brevibacillus laterosporus]CCF13651.1 hypothetical protein BLGI_1569 [Brevibacillus laterosporus GI-9]
MHVLDYNYVGAQIELRQRLQEALDRKGWKKKTLFWQRKLNQSPSVKYLTIDKK